MAFPSTSAILKSHNKKGQNKVQTAEKEVKVEQVAFRGRRPHMDTLDSRMIDLQTGVEKAEKRTGKVAAKRLTTMNEQAQELAYHFAGHKAKGIDIGERLSALEVIQNRIAAIVVLPGEKKEVTKTAKVVKEAKVIEEVWDGAEGVLRALTKIRTRKIELMDEIASLDILETEQLAELGRVEYERILQTA